jgi:CO/xanthine dehydrogenase Mo-binding subunit
LIEDRFAMSFIATESPTAGSDRRERGENLNIETAATNRLLPTDGKWGLRFNADGTVTIVLGMRDYGGGWFSAYFAGLVAARLGIPFRQVRVYYSATLPAVLQTPRPSRILLHGSTPGPVGRAAADVIEDICDRVIEKGRLAFAAMAGVAVADIGFDQPSGRFFVLDRARSGSISEIVEAGRSRSSMSADLTRNTKPGTGDFDEAVRRRNPPADSSTAPPARHR